MISTFDAQLIDRLVTKNLLNPEQATTLKASVQDGSNLADVLSKLGIDEMVWVPVLGEIFSLPFIDLSGKVIDANVLDKIPQDLAVSYSILPFEYDEASRHLKIAMVEPGDFKAIEAIEFLSRKQGWQPEYYVIGASNFRAIIKQYESLGAEAKEVLSSIEDVYTKKEEEQKQQEEEEKQGLEEKIKSAPVSKMVEVIFKHAVEAKASDIHIEPLDNASVVRYRVDGKLKISLKLPKHLHNSVVSRIKVLSNLKIDETRIPQDGRIRLSVSDMTIDMRISTLPLAGAEKVVIRILDTSGGSLTWEQLGFYGKNLKYVEENIKKPNGLFLVTGPTGSGKSTTLYSGLNVLNQEEVNIITLEDPIEYYLEGVNQSQVRPEIGYTFASGLRSILRQDPDIVMVGEIRDNETAELAIHAALTGHLVLSTLHTNDAIGAVPRFIDMQVEPFLLASTLNLVIAQRLVRKICDNCKETIELPERVTNIAKKILETTPESEIPKDLDIQKLVFYHGKGCARCGDTGYKGRLAVVEVLVMTPELQQMITDNDMTHIGDAFQKQGSLTMRQDGVVKALQGFTTMEEVLTATK
ncbi:MAG: GspE/PulE family protein [Patescibacteria group bacterium]